MESIMVSIKVTEDTEIKNEETFLRVGNPGENHLYLHVDKWETAYILSKWFESLQRSMMEAEDARKLNAPKD